MRAAPQARWLAELPAVALSCAALLSNTATMALAGELRDPTRPPAHAAAGARAEPTLVLSAVYSGANGHRCAIVDGEIVHDGSAVGPFRIEAVLADGVRYRHAGRVLELHLPRGLDMIKKPTAQPARPTSGVKP
ncbi:MAG: hypothetical protein KGL25_07370 [Gammaproteobacteria bacterium]|nr:hypothetical protein [Gammaproteobacteria bacterium]